MAAGYDHLRFIMGWWHGTTGTPSEDIVVIDGAWKSNERRTWVLPPKNRVAESGENRVWRTE